MPLPSFIIIGTTKGGTTSLYKYFAGHPEIYMSPIKEPRFFAFDGTGLGSDFKANSTFPVTSMAQYLELFSGVQDEKAIGEASPMYLNSPIASENIKRHIPEVKLIASLRNPVDRAYSHYLMYYREGRIEAPFIDGFTKKAATEENYSHYVRTSFYYSKLKRYYERFDRTRLKIIFLEDLQKNPLKVIQDLFQFIGVDDTFSPEMSKVHNLGGIPRSGSLYALARNGFLPAPIRKKLSSVIKPVLPRGLINLRKNLMNRSLEAPPPLDPAIRRQLMDFYREDILMTQDLVGIDLGAWLEQSVI